MKVPYYVILLADAISIISYTEASRIGRWKNRSKSKRWTDYESETNHICSVGECLPAWKCPEEAIVRESTGSCSYWKNGPWVCCDINEVHDGWTDSRFATNPSTQIYRGHSKRTARTDSWKQKTTTKIYGHDSEDGFTTPCSDDSWNRNAKPKPTPESSIGDLPGISRDRFSTRKPTYSPTKILSSITRKTTEVPRSRQTTPSNFVARTTRRKTETSDTRIVFPTENSGWTQKVTKHPIFQTQSTKSTGTKSTTKVPTRSTTQSGWLPSTKYTASTKSTGTRSTTKVPTRSTTKSGWLPSTKFTASTKSTGTKSTTKVPTRSTTKSGWLPSTKYTASTASSRKPTTSTRSWLNEVSNSEEKRHQGRAPPSPVHPAQDHRTSSRTTTRPSSAYTTAKTTSKYRVTTRMPNVNTYMCGTRVLNPAPSRRRVRASNLEDKSSVHVFHTDHRSSGSRKPYSRIVGGEEAEPFSWPWVAALYKVSSSGGHRFLSAGSLINEHFVLTAAHVFTPDDLKTSRYVVMLGTHNAQDAVAEYRVSSILPNPKYQHRYYYHDIALLRLESPVVFNEYVMPVCLPSPDAPLLRDRDLEGKTVTVMGWGDDAFGGKSSRVLKEASFPIVSRQSCNASYVRVASNRFPRGIIEEMLCAADPNGGKDACQGDSGGPLTRVEQGRHTQVGIVSFGYQCGNKDFPGVYTKVAPYLSWIAENTRNIEKDYRDDYDYRG